MKKILSLTLCLLMVLSLAACSGSSASNIKTGLGVVVSLDSSKAAEGDNGPIAQTDVTSCAASFDKDGKILSVTFDVAQNRVTFDKEGKLVTDITKPGTTKRELGDSYGMKAASAIGKEWYEQIDALQNWMVGKNVKDVLGMELTAETAPASTDLTSSVTISASQFLSALQKAYENAK